MRAVRTVRVSQIAAALAVLGKARVATELNTRGKRGSTPAKVRRKKRRMMQRQALGGCYFLGFRCCKGRKHGAAKVVQTDVLGEGGGGGADAAGGGEEGEQHPRSVRSAQQERQQLLLVIACADGRYKTASALIDENGCKPNEPDEEGVYPMTAAVSGEWCVV